MSLANSSELSSGKRKKAIRSTVDGLVSVLKVLKAGTSEACPPAATVAELLIMVCEAFKTSCDNLEAIEELRSHIYDLQNALSALSAGAKNPLSPALSDFVTRFESEVRTITADIEKASKRSRFKQLLSAKDTSEKVTGCVKRLSQCVNSLLIGITADSNRKTTVIHENVEDLRRDVGDISVMIDTQNNAVPGLRRVAEARFDYYKSGRSACTKDTRLEALSTIYHWLVPDDPNFEELPPPLMETSGDKPTFWINGVAGSGKSTIAQTIAQWCMDQDILAASFFCARDGNRSNVQLIIPTIAYQLSSHSPAFRAALAAAIEADTDIHVAYATHQLRKLIVEPLKAVTEPLTKFVVIVDALDECKDDAAVSVILTALSAHVDDLAPLKFIITSRPETHIVSGFKLKPLSQTTEQLVLSAVPEEMTTRDIGIYFREEFNTVRESRGLDPAWPVDRDVEVLTEKSHGLFIYAATAAKFVCGDDIEDPVEQLKILLLQIGGSPSSESVPRPTQESHFRELDNLYLQVLASAFPDMNALKKHFLGALALAPDRVSLHTIAVMFGANAHVLSTFLSRLQSIILPSASHDEPLRLSHLSFAEFIVDPARCINTRYLVDRCMQHAVMAKGCLKILIENLLFNICKVEDTSLLNEEVPDLESRIFKHIPPHLQYACRHWAYHTTNAEVDEELLDLVKQFSERKLLDWLSALSILGSMDITVDALQTSRRALENASSQRLQNMTSRLLYDCERAVRLTYPAVAASWSEIYRCILTFSPTESLLLQTYTKQPLFPILRLDRLSVKLGAWMHWPHDTLTIDTQHQIVNSISVSPDGQVVVFGAVDTIGLCNARTGALLHTMTTTEPYAEICAAAISPDGQRILSCISRQGSPGVVEEWDIATGACLSSSRHLHPDLVFCIKYSPDGHNAALCSSNKTISIWDTASTAESATVLTGHENWVRQITFTRDSKLLLSASYDHTARVWDVRTKQCVQSLQHETEVYSISISHDNALAACGCDDGVITLWDRRTWSALRHIRTQPTYWTAVDFSPNDTKLAAGSNHGLIEIYDVATGHLLSTLFAHSILTLIWTMQLSPDGQYVVSAGGDPLVRITSMQTEAISDDVVLWSQDIMSRWPEWMVRPLLPSSRTVKNQKQPSRQTQTLVRSISFSSDGALVACGGVGMDLVILDTASGEEKMCLLSPGRTHSSEVTFLKWSSTGHLLMAGTLLDKDCKIFVWGVNDSHGPPATKPAFVVDHLNSEVWAGCFAHDDQSIMYGDLNAIHLRSLQRNQPTVPPSTIHQGNYRVTAIAVSSDSTLVLAGFLDRSSPSSDPIAHPPPSNVPYHVPDNYDSRTTKISVYPTLRLIDVQSGQVLWLENFTSIITSVAFSLDSTRALVGMFADMAPLDVSQYHRQSTSNANQMDTASSAAPILGWVHTKDRNLVEAVSFSVDGHAIVSNTSFTSLPTDHMPLNHTSEPSTTPVYIVEHGWVWRIVEHRCRRMGWIPPEFRDGRDTIWMREKGGMAISGNQLAFSRKDGGMTLIHVVDRAT